MDLRRFLHTGFEYDLWANRQWLTALGGFTDLLPAQSVLDHILAAQRIWLERIGAQVPVQTEDTSLADRFGVVTRVWTAVVGTADLDQAITYRTFAGDDYTDSLSRIALHVINHGTYHRGQLRGLAQAEGRTDFPETDLIRYFREGF